MRLSGLESLVIFGVFLIILGAILVAIPFIVRLGVKPENVHPLILVWKKFDGLYLGTSPILLIILLIIYILFFFKRF